MITDPATLGLFMAASVALYIAPGPDMIYVASRAMGQGRRAGAVSALGVSTGIIVHILGASFGLAALLKVWPAAFMLIKWGGVAYLVYLGLRALASKEDGFGAEAKSGRRTAWRLFRQGVLCNMLNPKIALFFLAFLPQFADPAKGDVTTQMLFYGAVFWTGGLVFILLIAYLFGGVGNWLAERPQLMRLQRWVTGSSMLGLALFVALDERE